VNATAALDAITGELVRILTKMRLEHEGVEKASHRLSELGLAE
jgi:hypothetical protein